MKIYIVASSIPIVSSRTKTSNPVYVAVLECVCVCVCVCIPFMPTAGQNLFVVFSSFCYLEDEKGMIV